MRAAFQFALSFAKTEKRGGIQQIIQSCSRLRAGDAKTTIELAGAELACMRALDRLRQAHSSSLSTPGVRIGSSGAGHYNPCSERRSYGHELPLAVCFRTLCVPLFAGGNIGVRRRSCTGLCSIRV